MNYFPKYLGTWLKHTLGLTLAEEGAYGRLLDAYYAHEKPLPLKPGELYKLARVVTATERQVVKRVIARYFVQCDDGYRHERADREIVSIRKRSESTSNLRTDSNARKQRYRDRRKAMFARARELGLTPGIDVTNEELSAAIVQAGGTLDGLRSRDVDGTRSTVAVDGNGAAIAEIPKSKSSPEGEQEARNVDVTRRATRSGTVCKRMRSVGLVETNPGDPRLLELIDAGVDDETFHLVAAEAVARRKGWGWVLATIAGRRSDHAQEADQATQWAPLLRGGA